ncbi:MAG: tail-specific protease [Actinobacteria bacterium]|nr:tail-specific protease [Actinomycetota bacterium]|tara:strand:+ start:2801 stop:4942 length:2142 start_codon:yes stop_codon:yes gene_type:complete
MSILFKKLFRNKKTSVLAFILLVSIFLFGYSKQKALQELVVYSVLNNHFSPVQIKDDYSENVFNQFLKKMDPNKRFFTQEDIAQLSLYKYAIDDHIESGNFKFLNTAFDIYMARLEFLNTYIPTLFDKPFSFTKKQTLETDSDKRTFSKNETELQAYWNKLIEYQVLTRYINLKQGLVSKNETISHTFDKKLEKEAREKTKTEVLESFTRLQEETLDDFRDLYFDSMINVFDTHTSYFPSERKEDFDISISGKLEGIGAVLREEDGFIKVVRIVPGSASWKQGELKAEDVILKVAQDLDKDPVSIVGVRIKKAVKLIRGKKGSTVRLTVKHPTGEVSEIPIVRDIVIIEETYSKHAILKDSRFDKTFGYISLPKFYRDFKNPLGRNTTNDIQKALVDINKAGVDGVIFDLRDNEGGALVDAVYSAGLFINEGPIVQVRGRTSMYDKILNDTDEDILYDGPLIILLNSYSASASEIFAAALQDYGRAVVVGSNTFGKGTVQTFVELDKLSPTRSAFFKDLGSVKLTIQKFYRINGGSTQHKGVLPDIILPNKADHLEVGERYLDYALGWDTVKPLSYSQWYHQNLDIDKLAKLSKKRISKSDRYKSLYSHLSFIKKRSETTYVFLDSKKAISKKLEANKELDTYNETIKKLDNLSFTIPHNKQLSEAQQESYKDWVENIEKDIDISESSAILNDLISEISSLTARHSEDMSVIE